jgi:hypothetical protein
MSGKAASWAASTRPRAAADDQDVDLLREGVRPRRDRRVRLLDERVTGLVAVEIELHRRCSSAMSLPKWWHPTALAEHTILL